jgi:hypothetical protein
MEGNEKQEQVKKLTKGRENINLLQNMLKKEHWNVDHELLLVDEAKRNPNDVLYELTGDKFYLNV